MTSTPGSTIRARRIELDISQEALAERMGMSLKTVGRLERDQTVPELLTLGRLDRVLGWDAGTSAALYAAVEPEPAPPADSGPRYAMDDSVFATIADPEARAIAIAAAQAAAHAAIDAVFESLKRR